MEQEKERWQLLDLDGAGMDVMWITFGV